MRKWILLFSTFVVSLVLSISACKKDEKTPSAPVPPADTATFTPTITLTPTVTLTPTITLTPTVTLSPTVTSTPTITSTPTSPVLWASGYTGINNREYGPGTPTPSYHNVNLRFSAMDTPITDASVTVILPSTTPVPIPYTGVVNLGGHDYGNYAKGIWPPDTCVHGGTYIVHVMTSYGLGAVTATYPGGVTVSTDGLQAGWTQSGMYHSVYVYDMTPAMVYNASYSDGATSAAIPPSAYPTPGVDYLVLIMVFNRTQAIAGALPGSRFDLEDGYAVTIHK
jgi:hypothetical protein